MTLQENRPWTDSTNHKSYKYYKFTLTEDPHATEIHVDMTTWHGDADIFISKAEEFPTMEIKEWSSQRVGGIADHVSINDTDLAGTYYIAVYGYAFSTY